MGNYSVKIKTAHFNDALTINYESEKNQIVDLVTKDGMFLGTYRNGKKLTNIMSSDSIKIEVEI